MLDVPLAVMKLTHGILWSREINSAEFCKSYHVTICCSRVTSSQNVGEIG